MNRSQIVHLSNGIYAVVRNDFIKDYLTQYFPYNFIYQFDIILDLFVTVSAQY